MSKSPTIECACCGCEMRDDESYWAEGYDSGVCPHCYDEIIETCQLSGEDLMPSDVSQYILVKPELSLPRRLPGIYRVISKPFIFGSLIGPDHLEGEYVRFVAPLPEPDDKFEISGHIGHAAAKPYKKICRATYGKDGLGTYDRRAWETERAHTRRAFLQNPLRLQDLELDPEDDDWIALKARYNLPADAKPYSDWLAIEHKGVRVYFCYRGSWGWMTLRPEPRFRNTWGRYNGSIIFDASSLPTFVYPDDQDGRRYVYESEKQESYRKAVIRAIDEGFLTQDRVVKKQEALA